MREWHRPRKTQYAKHNNRYTYVIDNPVYRVGMILVVFSKVNINGALWRGLSFHGMKKAMAGAIALQI